MATERRALFPERSPSKGDADKWLIDLFRWGLGLSRRITGRTILECKGSVATSELKDDDIAIEKSGNKIIFKAKVNGAIKTTELTLE